MISSFADVGLSLNNEGSEDHKMKFQDVLTTETKREANLKTVFKFWIDVGGAISKKNIQNFSTDLVNVFALCRYI